MAIAFRSSNFYTLGIQSSLPVTKPTGLTVGDLMVAQFSLPTGATPTVPSGFTLLGSATSNGTYSMRMYYKFADSSDVAASTFTFTSSTSDYTFAGIMAFSGASIPQPIFSNNKIQSTFQNPTISVASISVLANSIICLFNTITDISNSSSGYAIATSNPSWTEDWDNATATMSVSAAHSSVRSVSTDTGVGTTTISGGGNVGAFMISIPPDQSITINDTLSLTEIIKQGISILKLEIMALTEVYTSLKSRIWRTVIKPITTWINPNK